MLYRLLEPTRFLDDFVWHPCIWPFVLFFPFLLLLLSAPVTGFAAWFAKRRRAILFTCSAVVLFSALLLAGGYVRAHRFFGHFETQTASVAWLFDQGKPIYQHPLTEVRYNSSPYGPMQFILTGFSQKLLGPSMFSTKLPVALAALGGLAFIFFSIKGKLGSVVALFFAALAAALTLDQYFPCFLFVRSDPYLFFCVSAAVFGLTRRRTAGALLLGLSIGVAINLKITAFVFFLPLFGLALQQRWSIKSWLLAGGVGAVVAALPFVLFPQVSLQGYLALLHQSSQRHLESFLCLPYFEWSVALLLTAIFPLFLWKVADQTALAGLQKNGLAYAGALLGLLALSVPATLEGAGTHHLVPFLPVMAVLAANLYADLRALPAGERVLSPVPAALIASFFVFGGGMASLRALRLAREYWHDQDARSCWVDVADILREKSGFVILAAPGGLDDDWTNHAHLELLFHGMPIGIDADALMDFREAQIPEPTLVNLIAEVTGGNQKPVLWISPRGSDPFALHTFFRPTVQVFSEKFRSDFAQMFELSGHTPRFDLYTQRIRNNSGVSGGNEQR